MIAALKFYSFADEQSVDAFEELIALDQGEVARTVLAKARALEKGV